MTANTNMPATTEAPAKRKPGRPKKVKPAAEAVPVVDAAPIDFKTLATETRVQRGARLRSRAVPTSGETAEPDALPPIGSRVLARLHDSDGDRKAPFEATVKSHPTEKQQAFSDIEHAVLTVEDSAHGTNDVRADEVTLLEMSRAPMPASITRNPIRGRSTSTSVARTGHRGSPSQFSLRLSRAETWRPRWGSRTTASFS